MTLENGTVGGSASAENKDHTIKQPPQRFQIPRDILDDLASRFIINVPVEERSDLIRICFQIELAHWFYLDFYCGGDKDEKLVEVNIKYFALHIFKHISFLKEHLPRLETIINEFKQYKMSVPTYGAILMTPDKKRVLLVQSYWAKTSWGFPKGKVNEDEDPMHCAIREVYEETGFDSCRLIRPDDYIEAVINYQLSRLYIVPNVPVDTVFAPRTRKEIKACEWFQLDCLPRHKTDTVCKETLGLRANSFYMIQPFVNQLKRWLADQSTNGAKAPSAANGAVRLAKRSTNGTSSITGAQLPQSVAAMASKQRQRNASTGDLDNVKTETKVVAVNRPKTVQQLAAAPTNHTTPNASSSTTATLQAKQKGNFKRQLFSGATATTNGDAVHPLAAVATNGNTVRQPSTSNAFVLRDAAPRPPVATAAKPPHTSSAGDQQQAVSQPLLSAATTATTNGADLTGADKKKRRRAKSEKTKLKSQQVRPIESFLQAMNADPAIQLWKNFTFTDRAAITCTLPPFNGSVY